MKKLIAAPKVPLWEIVRLNIPILTWDLKFGIIIFESRVNRSFGVQVPGEADCRHVLVANIYQEDRRLLEALATYTDEQIEQIYRSLNDMDADQARFIIAALEQVGFDIEYEDFRTMQDGYVVRFDFNPPPSRAGKLTIQGIGHRPTVCARYGHSWGPPEIAVVFEDAVATVTCGHCGRSEPVPYKD